MIDDDQPVGSGPATPPSYGEDVSDIDPTPASPAGESPSSAKPAEPAKQASGDVAETSPVTPLSVVPPLPVASPAAAAYAGDRPTPYGSSPYATIADLPVVPQRPLFEMADLWTALLGTVAVLGLGVIAGLVWYLVAPRAAAVRNAQTFGTIDPYTKAFVRDDLTFLAITLVAGVLCAVVAALIARQRGVAVAVAMAVGGFAAAYLAAWLGRFLTGGPALHWAHHTAVGNHRYFIALTDRQFLVGWPLIAVVVTLLITVIVAPRPAENQPPAHWSVDL